MKKYSVICLVIALVLCLSACGCKHEWQDATCTSPRRCKLCDKTEGETIPHDWKDATCTDPKTCRVCGETEGEANGHDWQDATCQNPKTCKVCEVTEGDVLAHTPGVWVDGEPDYIAAEQQRVQLCAVCNEVADTETVPIKSLHDEKCIFPSPEEIAQRFINAMNDMTGNVNASILPGNEYFTLATSLGGKYTGSFLFTDPSGETILTEQQGKDRRSAGKMVGIIGDIDAAASSMVAMFEAMEPSLTFEQAKEKALELSRKEEMHLYGIKYLFSKLDDEYVIGFTIE